jgi:hypothetical protein
VVEGDVGQPKEGVGGKVEEVLHQLHHDALRRERGLGKTNTKCVPGVSLGPLGQFRCRYLCTYFHGHEVFEI